MLLFKYTGEPAVSQYAVSIHLTIQVQGAGEAPEPPPTSHGGGWVGVNRSKVGTGRAGVGTNNG